MPNEAKLLLIGCGKMGGAFLRRAIGKASSIYVIEPTAQPEELKNPGKVFWCATPDKIDAEFKPDLIIIALKPQQLADALPRYKHFKETLFLSIAAGVTISRIENLTTHTRVVRAMPNLPASIGKGISVAVAGKAVDGSARALCETYLKVLGEVLWADDESVLDAVTAVSGSGPAYVFALCEAMAKAGEALGLPASMAATLARQTVIGSGALLAGSNESAAVLRQAVSSPGGTTEAALKILQASHGLNELLQNAIREAAKRAKELAQ